MDANRKLALGCASAICVMAGCYPPNTGPIFRSQETAPADPPQLTSLADEAKAPARDTADSEDVDQAVQGYIAQIDGVGQRARRWQLPKEHESAPGAAPDDTEPRPIPSHPGSEPAPDQPDQAGPGTAPSAEPPPAAAAPPATTPPVLELVSARAMPEPAPQLPARSATVPVEMNAPASARHAPLTLEQFLEQWPGTGDGESYRAQLDRRIMRVVAGDYEEARQPLSMVSDAQQQMATRLIESLIAIRAAHDGDPAAAADRVLQQLSQLTESLRPLSELQIPTVAICQEVQGYGQYRLIDPPRFATGVPAEFVVYCEVSDFVSQKQDDGLYRTSFELRTQVLNRGGEVVLELRDADVVDLCRQQRHDCFVPRLVSLPATLSPGEYVVKVTIIDKLGDKMAENRATFQVVAAP